MKRSPFFHDIVKHSPELTTVQGWTVPNAFTGQANEHRAVREQVGLFDWSTTGEIEVKGPQALSLVQQVIVNDAAAMPLGRVIYTSILTSEGSMVSDITVYRLGAEHYMLMTAWGSNAADERPELSLLREVGSDLDATVTDVSSGVGLLAVQGPRSRDLLSTLIEGDLSDLRYMWATRTRVAGIRSIISRSGYTGELGYEILIPAEHAHDLWEALTTAGKPLGLTLCGMKAAFSLRIEKGYIMRFDFQGRTPYEVGLGWTVKEQKHSFIGKERLLARKEAGFHQRLMGLLLQDGYVPNPGDVIIAAGKKVGDVSSAAFGHTLEIPVALGFVPNRLCKPGVEVTVVDPDGGQHPAVVAERPMYDPAGERLHR